MKRVIALAALALVMACSQKSHAEIVFTGGGGDITFYYESAADRWDVVFRRKADTVATGLTSPYSGFTGIVGHSAANDFNFNPSLSVNFATDRFVNVGATQFAVSSALGSPLGSGSVLANSVSPDVGIRTRLREDLGAGVVQQFDSFDLTLNLANSTFNGVSLANAGSPFVSLLSWSGNDPDPLFNSAANSLTANFPNYEHVHRNWGFSQFGEYVLNFDFQGVGGTHGATASSGNFSVGFNVSAVPEPSTVALIAAGLGIAAFRARRKTHKPATVETAVA